MSRTGSGLYRLSSSSSIQSPLARSYYQNTAPYAFTSPTGAINPVPGLTMGKDGVLYGTSYNGGTWGTRVVYAMKPPASPGAGWTETLVQSFQWGSASGASLSTPVTVGKDGVLYGTTTHGGVPGAFGYGAIFSLKP